MDELKKNNPLVSVAVIAYNSANTIVETLDSIATQDYQNLELIISDDGSSDNTMSLCREWVEQNKERFVRVEIIKSDKNLGVSANSNRAEAVCKGEWVKGIAGDDILLPTCIKDCVEYVTAHPETVYLFGKIQCFGAPPKRCKDVEDFFDYSFFSLSIEEQLERLLFVFNCIPAPTTFYNLRNSIELGISNDERIPLLEDWPKWINCLRKGVRFGFLDKVLVKYRLGGIATNDKVSLRSYESFQLFKFYYQFPEWIKRDEDDAISRIVKEQVDQYDELLKTEKKLNQVLSSKAYRLGKLLLRPWNKIYTLFHFS